MSLLRNNPRQSTTTQFWGGENILKSPPFLSCLVIGLVTIAIAVLPGCAGGRDAGGPPRPVYKDFPATPTQLTPIVETAIMQSSYGLRLDARASLPGRLVTVEQPLQLRTFRALAKPGKPKLRGKLLRATLQLAVSIQTAPGSPDHSRVRFEPVYKVYLSRLGDRRQWIQWQSNSRLERHLLETIEELFESTAP